MRRLLVAAVAVSGALVGAMACSSDEAQQGGPGAPQDQQSPTLGAAALDASNWQSITPDDIERAGLDIVGGYGMTAESYESLQKEAAGRLAGVTTLYAKPGSPSQPAATAAPVIIRQTVIVAATPQSLAMTATPAPTSTPAPRPGSGSASPADDGLDEQVAQQSVQQRVIVRNVSMSVEVDRVAAALETIGRLANVTGGWVVSSSMLTDYQGFISIRVPADRLDASLAQIRQITRKVERETATSQDFTEEFTDQSARLKTLKDTQDTLRALFARAEKIEDAIRVQVEITKIQTEVEKIEGRLGFLQQSAAFSIINVDLRSVSAPITVAAGPDITVAREAPMQFRAEFNPPAGFEDFTVEWDFGDGSPVTVTARIAPRPQGGRVSSPVDHVYSDEEQSPYIVKAKVRGTGDAGVAEGTDTVIVTVTGLPVIVSDAGADRTMATGTVEQFRVEFVPLDEIKDYSFEWDFGDGSGPEFVNRSAPTSDGKRVSAPVSHAYGNEEDSPYIVTVKVRGSGKAGVAEGEDTLVATVTRIPAIEVFSGQNKRVVEGERVEFEGSFTRPEGLANLRYSWDFGDGSAPSEGELTAGLSSASATHVYLNDRPAPFLVTLTIKGDSPAGTAEAKSSIAVYVRAQQDWTADGLSPSDTGRTAVRALSAIGNGLLAAGIWLAIFSPFWIIGGVVWFTAYKRRNRSRRTSAPELPGAASP